MTDEAFSGREPCPITAELIARADGYLQSWGNLSRADNLIKAMRDRLAAQAQEIEQARRDAATERTLRLSLEGERNAAEARVRELERKIEVQEMAMDTARSIWEQKLAARQAGGTVS
jgi:hypothetical protein